MSVPTRWAVTSCVFDPLADEVLEIVDTEQVRVVQDADALAGSCGVPVPVRARPVRGQAAVKTSLPWPCTGRIAAACPEIFNMLADLMRAAAQVGSAAAAAPRTLPRPLT